MLQFIRSKAGSYVVKLLFVLLIGSFAFFGIGDFLRQKTNTDTTVITVGSTKIPAAAVQHDVQAQLNRLRETSRSPLTIEQAKALGLVDQIVDGIVTRTLIDDAATAEHLAIGPAQILSAIQQEPGFHDKDGSFNRDLLRNALAANGLSVQQFESTIRDDLGRNLVTSPVRVGAQPPNQLVTLLYQIRNERRVADWVFLPTNSVKDPPAPDTPSLQDFYAKHHELYTAPEYRGIAVLTLTLADVLDTIHPSDQELRDAYQQRQDEFTIPEQRHILQMLLQDKVAADQAEAQLQQGQDFFDVAKQLAKQDKSAVDLDWVKKAELPGAVGDFAFGEAENSVSQPIKGDFGWSILKITGIKPAHGKSFDEAKAELEASLKNDQGADALYKLSNKIEDAIAAGTDFDGLAQRFNLKPQRIAAIDATGSVPDGTPLANPPVPVDMLTKTAFSTADGQMSGMQDSGNGNAFFVLKIEHVTPSVLKPFADVKSQVQNAWMTDRKADLLADAVKKFMADVTKNVTFADVAKTRALTIGTSKPFLRSAKQPESGLPEELTSKLFHVGQGQTASAMTQDGAYVAQLKSVIAADPGAAPTAADTLRQELAQDLATEYVTEFAASLKRRFPVEVKTAAIDQLFPSGTQ